MNPAEAVHTITMSQANAVLIEPGTTIVMSDGSVWTVSGRLGVTTLIVRPFPWYKRFWARLCSTWNRYGVWLIVAAVIGIYGVAVIGCLLAISQAARP